MLDCDVDELVSTLRLDNSRIDAVLEHITQSRDEIAELAELVG